MTSARFYNHLEENDNNSVSSNGERIPINQWGFSSRRRRLAVAIAAVVVIAAGISVGGVYLSLRLGNEAVEDLESSSEPNINNEGACHFKLLLQEPEFNRGGWPTTLAAELASTDESIQIVNTTQFDVQKCMNSTQQSQQASAWWTSMGYSPDDVQRLPQLHQEAQQNHTSKPDKQLQLELQLRPDMPPIMFDLSLLENDQDYGMHASALVDNGLESSNNRGVRLSGVDEFNMIVDKNGYMSGSAHVGSSIFYITTLEDGSTSIAKVNVRDLPPEGEPLEEEGEEELLIELDHPIKDDDEPIPDYYVPITVTHKHRPSLRNIQAKDREPPMTIGDPYPNRPSNPLVSYIDVLVPVTRRAFCAMVNAHSLSRCVVNERRMQMVLQRVRLAIFESNVALQKSGISNKQFRLAHTYIIDGNKTRPEDIFDENINGRTYSDILKMAARTDDGELLDLPVLRDAYGADVVVIWTANAQQCGLAYSGMPISPEWAYAAVYYQCATGYYSFVHEIAHMLGARHDRASQACNIDSDVAQSILTNETFTADQLGSLLNPTRDPRDKCCGGLNTFSYQTVPCDNFGYQDSSNRYRSIMAYDCPTPNGCPRVQIFSQPDHKYAVWETTQGPEPSKKQVFLQIGNKLYNNARQIEFAWETVANYRDETVLPQVNPELNQTNSTAELCGNGVCDFDESCESCRQDCIFGESYLYQVDSTLAPLCGNGICELGEHCQNCAEDCPSRISEIESSYCCFGGGGATVSIAPKQFNLSAITFAVACDVNPYCTMNAQCDTRRAVIPSSSIDADRPVIFDEKNAHFVNWNATNNFCCGDGICERGEGVWNCSPDCVCINDGFCDPTFEDATCSDCLNYTTPTDIVTFVLAEQCLSQGTECLYITPDPCCGSCDEQTGACKP